MTSYLDAYIGGGEVDALPPPGPVRPTEEVMADAERWYTTAQAAEFFPGKNGRPSKSDQWIYWAMRNGRFTYPEGTPLEVGDPVVHVSWTVQGAYNPRIQAFESLPVKGTVMVLLPDNKMTVAWDQPGHYPDYVDFDQVLKLVEPWRVGKAGRRRFSLPMIQDIALSWHRQGNFREDELRVVLKRIELAIRDEKYCGVF